MTAHTLYQGATHYARAALVLCPDYGSIVIMAQIGAHAVELGLKAFLLSKGMTEAEFTSRDGIGHDLERAWAECVRRGIQTPCPPWLSFINMQFGAPFIYRYWREGIGWGLPGTPETFAQSVKALVLDIGREIGEDHHGVLASPGERKA